MKLTKPWTPEIFMECYCVARNKPIRREITKPQTATVSSLWFWGLLACPELYCDWSVHNQNSCSFSGVHGFLSLTVTSVAKGRGSWVVGRGHGSWVWVWVLVSWVKKYFQKKIKIRKSKSKISWILLLLKVVKFMKRKSPRTCQSYSLFQRSAKQISESFRWNGR